MGDEEIGVGTEGEIVDGGGGVHDDDRVAAGGGVSVEELAGQDLEAGVREVEIKAVQVEAIDADAEGIDGAFQEGFVDDDAVFAGADVESVDDTGEGVGDEDDVVFAGEWCDPVEEQGVGEIGDFGDGGWAPVMDGERFQIHFPYAGATWFEGAGFEVGGDGDDVEFIAAEFGDTDEAGGVWKRMDQNGIPLSFRIDLIQFRAAEDRR